MSFNNDSLRTIASVRVIDLLKVEKEREILGREILLSVFKTNFFLRKVSLFSFC
jgi:hypothetical protein